MAAFNFFDGSPETVKQPKHILTDTEIQQINETLAAGRPGPVKILPVVCESSSRYERAEEMMGLWAVALGLAMLWLFFAEAPAGTGKIWTFASGVWKWGLFPILLTVAAGFIAGSCMVHYLVWLRRLFITKKQMDTAVQTQARIVFNDNFVRFRNEDQSVLLIYLSLYERSVLVLQDEMARTKLSSEQIETVRDLVLKGLEARQPAEGLRAGIDGAKKLLGAYCSPAATPPDSPPLMVQVIPMA